MNKFTKKNINKNLDNIHSKQNVLNLGKHRHTKEIDLPDLIFYLF